jgi:hypothetical protein
VIALTETEATTILAERREPHVPQGQQVGIGTRRRLQGLTGASMIIGFYNLAEYVAKGRYLKEVSLEKLAEDWFTTLVDVADDPGDMLAQARLNDLVSEFHLRCGTPLPYYRIGRGAPQYLREVDEARELLRKDHPEVYAAAQQKQNVYASKLRSARNVAGAQQGYLPPRETWRSLHDISQKVLHQAAEALTRSRISSPSIVPSDSPDDCDCPATPPDHKKPGKAETA